MGGRNVSTITTSIYFEPRAIAESCRCLFRPDPGDEDRDGDGEDGHGPDVLSGPVAEILGAEALLGGASFAAAVAFRALGVGEAVAGHGWKKMSMVKDKRYLRTIRTMRNALRVGGLCSTEEASLPPTQQPGFESRL